jgi:hypothetical protein
MCIEEVNPKPLVLLIANYINYIEENFSQIIDKWLLIENKTGGFKCLQK